MYLYLDIPTFMYV